MRLNHNMFSMGIYKNYKRTLVENSKALGNISSGKKLNSAKDNPNKIADSENLKMNLLSRDAASKNIQDTNSMLQTFDGALQEINNNIARLKQLTVKGATGTNNVGDEAVIQQEIDKIKDSIDYLANNTKFNSIVLSDSSVVNNSSPNSRKSTIGALANENIDIPFFNLSAAGLKIDVVDVTDPTKLNTNIQAIDNAGVMVSSIRSKYGAIQSRLEDTGNDIDSTNESLSKAQSGLEDADIAQESLEYSRTKIIYQAATALMVQSNKLPQNALNVLASVR